jgi:hypothetical protein
MPEMTSKLMEKNISLCVKTTYWASWIEKGGNELWLPK